MSHAPGAGEDKPIVITPDPALPERIAVAIHADSERASRAVAAEIAGLIRARAAEGRRAYRELVEAEGFTDYYSAATPIDALERSNIGSRPARRRTPA